MARLNCTRGQSDPDALELNPAHDNATWTIGRANDCDLRLLDESASRQHASITWKDGRAVLEDLGSANGTTLNGDTIAQPVTLVEGDVVAFGHVSFTYTAGDLALRATAIAQTDDDVPVAAALSPDAIDPVIDARSKGASVRLQLVMDSATACVQAETPNDLYQTVVSLVADRLQADRVSLVVVRPGSELMVGASHPPGAGPPASTTIRSRVLDLGESILVTDAHETLARSAANQPSSASIVASRYRTLAAAPLRVVEGVLGLLSVEYLEPNRLEAVDLHTLAAVSCQAALALRTIRALETLRGAPSDSATRGSAPQTELVGESPEMDRLRSQLSKAAPTDASVLLTGETGTGKELAARAVHNQSARASSPFVALNCAALVEGLLESELFGHEKGAFTGAVKRHDGRIAQAGTGTLFLDEAGELPLAMQAKLLRVLSERAYRRVGGKSLEPVHCRIVAATNRDLKQDMAHGTFREDLYYRLAVVVISLPPLRERGGDIERLAETALTRIAATLGRRVPRMAADARACLNDYRWPGNVRELFNTMERVLVLLEGDTIHASDLPLDIRLGTRVPATASHDVLTLREAERRAVEAALRHTGGKKGEAAKLLGTSWPTLNRKIREYGIDVPPK